MGFGVLSTKKCPLTFDLWFAFVTLLIVTYQAQMSHIRLLSPVPKYLTCDYHLYTIRRNIKHKYHTYMTIKCRLETFNTWLSFIHIIRQCDTSEKNVFQDLWCLIVICRISCSPWYFFLYILYCILVLLLISAFAMLPPIIRH